MNKMLFKAIMIQGALIWIFGAIPSTILGAMVAFQIPSGNLVAQICMFMPLFYANLDALTLLYFIRPYRDYIKKMFGNFLIWIRLKKVAPSSAPIMDTNVLNLS
uniref:Uncharacterized protein n=1 Tax=Acrobeloides nanus TaxID=290746 RepID=A0A914D729_9BILA